ncbi:hypothetical protein V6N11_060347 [Hibiscus sabdariffa]|uniref:Uncharacterized protein n=1 Tax=Hibiscus sabdariffa TaxID=183260 RepID=A0ABR2QQL7_9ROSI
MESMVGLFESLSLCLPLQHFVDGDVEFSFVFALRTAILFLEFTAFEAFKPGSPLVMEDSSCNGILLLFPIGDDITLKRHYWTHESEEAVEATTEHMDDGDDVREWVLKKTRFKVYQHLEPRDFASYRRRAVNPLSSTSTDHLPELRDMNWIQRKIYLYNVTFGLYMLDWWERYLFNTLVIVLMWFVFYNSSRYVTEFCKRHLS